MAPSTMGQPLVSSSAAVRSLSSSCIQRRLVFIASANNVAPDQSTGQVTLIPIGAEPETRALAFVSVAAIVGADSGRAHPRSVRQAIPAAKILVLDPRNIVMGSLLSLLHVALVVPGRWRSERTEWRGFSWRPMRPRPAR